MISREAADTVRAWADAYGMPRDYAAVDVESTGLDVEKDAVLQLGWCLVKGTKAVENAGVCPNCLDGLSAPEADVLCARMAKTAAHMQDRGMAYEWTPARVRRGAAPTAAYAKIVEVCGGVDHLLTHFGTKFDYPMLDRCTRQYAGVGLPAYESGRLRDTHILYKAAVAGVRPRAGESYTSCALRVTSSRDRTPCALKAIVGDLGLREKFGAVDRRAHDAVYDAWLTHLVYETLREAAGLGDG